MIARCIEKGTDSTVNLGQLLAQDKGYTAKHGTAKDLESDRPESIAQLHNFTAGRLWASCFNHFDILFPDL